LASLFEEFSQTTRRLQESHRGLEARIVELRRELAEKNLLLERKKRLESLGLMVAGVAHEIRNPLGSISLYLDCLSEEVRGASSRSECLRLIRQIEEAIAHLNSIVVNMLSFASPAETRWEDCDLAVVAQEALDLLKKDLDQSRIRYRFEPPEASRPAQLWIAGDRDQVRCVLLNILKNAVQAMDPDGALTLAARRARGEGRLYQVLSIRDTGPGIPPENLEQVFIPFFTAGKKKGGVGLGLTIVHSLMERLGGKVELENLPWGGVEVRLFFLASEGPRGQGGKTGCCQENATEGLKS
jgi:two-component system NtrC family sensor kinase